MGSGTDADGEESEEKDEDDETEDDSLANDTDDNVPLDDWHPMLESDDIFLPSIKSSQPPAKLEATKPKIVVQDSDDDEPMIIDHEKRVGRHMAGESEEPPISQAATKKRKSVSFTGIATVESDDSSELTSLNPDDIDSDLEVLHSRRKPAPQSPEPAPMGRRPVFIKTEVKSPNPSVGSVPSVPKTESETKKRLQPIKHEEDDISSEDVGEGNFSEDDDEGDDDYEDVEVERGSKKRKRNNSGQFARNTGPAVCFQCREHTQQ